MNIKPLEFKKTELIISKHCLFCSLFCFLFFVSVYDNRSSSIKSASALSLANTGVDAEGRGGEIVHEELWGGLQEIMPSQCCAKNCTHRNDNEYEVMGEEKLKNK